VVTLAFVAVAGFAMAGHEMWRDEAQPWLVALHSRSLPELFGHVRYEGHPGLWYALLFLASRLTDSPVAMQLLHLAIGAAAVWLVARYAPFTRLQRALFAFGYFPLYEYTVVSRDYGLGMLILLAACAAIGAGRRRFAVLVALIALLPQTNAFAAIVGLALGIALVVDRWLPGGRLLGEGVSPAAFASGIAVVAVSVGLAVLQVIPPPGLQLELPARARFGPGFLAKRFRAVVPALFPIPRVGPRWFREFALLNWWESSRLLGPAVLAAYGALGCLAVGLVRRPRALVFLASAVLLLVGFMYLEFPGELRHEGYFLVAIVMAVWLGRIEDARRPAGDDAGWPPRAWVAARGSLFTTLLGIQAVGGLMAVALERRYVFSEAKPAAAWLVEHHLDQAPLVAQHDFVQSVLVYLGRKEAYLVRSDRVGAFGMWDRERFPAVSDSTCVARARRIAAQAGEPVVLVADHALRLSAADSLDTRELARFTGSSVGDENFYLYSVSGQASAPR
jgi:hypothetical protein